MKNTIERIWTDYLLEKCSALETTEERILMEQASDLREKANSMLNQEQLNAVEKYLDALNILDTLFVKKAFTKGCEFAVSFILEAHPPSK